MRSDVKEEAPTQAGAGGHERSIAPRLPSHRALRQSSAMKPEARTTGAQRSRSAVSWRA